MATALNQKIAVGQNIVPNPSFEEITSDSCVLEANISMMPCVLNWYTVQGIPDYVNHRLNDHKIRAPLAKDGDAIIGLYLPYPGSLKLEYIETKLPKPLTKGSVYTAKVYVAKDLKHYPKSISGIGILISNAPLVDQIGSTNGIEQLKSIQKLQPQALEHSGTLLNKKNEWMLVQGTFTADGTEEYVSLGRFQLTDINDLTIGAYYYFDSISIVEQSSTLSLANLSTGSTPVKLTNLHFESGSVKIGTDSFDELNKLVDILKTNKEIILLISGHTDNSGNDIDNNALSLGRAEAVKVYLIEAGINTDRIVTKGFGASNPISSNNTAEGRLLNRRIEVQIIE